MSITCQNRENKKNSFLFISFFFLLLRQESKATKLRHETKQKTPMASLREKSLHPRAQPLFPNFPAHQLLKESSTVAENKFRMILFLFI